MKRTKLGLILISLVALASSLTGCTAALTGVDGCFDYAYRTNPKFCFIYGYEWDGDPATMDITIPDTIQGMEVSQLGGYYGRGCPMFFGVSIPSSLQPQIDDGKHGFITPDDDYVTDNDYEVYTFTIHLGRKIREFHMDSSSQYYYGEEAEDGSCQDIFYKVEYIFDVDSKNRYVEAVDGVLQMKEKEK